MIRRAFLLAAILLAACSQAQSLGAYLKLRKSSGITQPVTVATLDSMVGTRVIEVAGLVKGTFRVGERGSIMVERSTGGVTVVDCETVPSWLVGNEVKAR